MKDKIIWSKPDYKNHWGKVPNKEIEDLCRGISISNNSSTGDVIIKKEQYGRKISFIVYRVEKVGTQIEGIDTLSRQRAIEELKKLLKSKDLNSS